MESNKVVCPKCGATDSLWQNIRVVEVLKVVGLDAEYVEVDPEVCDRIGDTMEGFWCDACSRDFDLEQTLVHV